MARRREDGTVRLIKAGGWDPERMTTQKTKKTAGGNVKADQEWIAALDEGDLLEFPLNTTTKKRQLPDEVYWDVTYQFQGHAEEVDPAFFEDFYRSTPDRRCTGLAYIRDQRGGYILDLDNVRLQRPCLRPPLNGSMVCSRQPSSACPMRPRRRQLRS
jgi:hypothetical protein